MSEISDWLEAAARRERNVVRLEDALLTDRYWRYFWFRLRYFAARTAVALVVHAIRVALLYVAFPSTQFAVIVLLAAASALIGDAWWGALERLRETVRRLQRDGQAHRIPGHIGAWLRLTVRLALACGVAAGIWLVVALAAGWLGPVDLYGVVIIGGAGASMVARTYHSGAYALRRVYRPLPSLIAVDIGGLVGLLVLWPLIGSWAFPVAELMSLSAVVAMSLHYTSRTYRALGMPGLRALTRRGRALPSRDSMRLAVAPALASTLTGLDSLLVLTVLVGASHPATGASLIALLAALGPVIRAGFEWASLLYFDLVRLEAPLLARLRERFDRQVRRLALVIGTLAWLIAAGVGVAILGIREVTLLVALLPLLVSRSLLAACQVRAFVSGAYCAITLVGIALLPAFLGILVLVPAESLRLALVAVALLAAAAILLRVRGVPRGADRVASLIDLVGLLRRAQGRVVVTSVRLDQAHRLRGVTREERAAERWRQSMVARRLAGRVAGRGGVVAWVGPTTLVWFETGGGPPLDDLTVTDVSGGLLVGHPARSTFATGQEAAWSLGRSPSGVPRALPPLPTVEVMLGDFRRRFPGGHVLMPGAGDRGSGEMLGSRARAEVFRASLRFAQSLAQIPEPDDWDVSALVEGGALLALFLVPRTVPARERGRWRDEVRIWDVRTAAEGPMLSAPRGPGRTRRLSRPSWSRTMGCR